MILHIMADEKFTVGFVDFFNNNFSNCDIKYAIMSRHEKQRYVEKIKSLNNVVIIRNTLMDLARLIHLMIKADKIILHGLYNEYLFLILPLLKFYKKSYWIIMGGDLYSYITDPKYMYVLKKITIHNLKGIIVGIEGDYEIAKEIYNVKGKCFVCSGPNNIINKEDYFEISKKSENAKRRVLIGNSADEENRHTFIVDKIKDRVNKDAILIFPLSYGDPTNADLVKKYAKVNLDCTLCFLEDFIPLSEYKNLLKDVDIAVFAHERQQAFSNLVFLLSCGAKIYMNPKSTIWDWLNKRGIKVFDINTLDSNFLSPLDYETMLNNSELIRKYCSFERMCNDWEKVFED